MRTPASNRWGGCNGYWKDEIFNNCMDAEVFYDGPPTPAPPPGPPTPEPPSPAPCADPSAVYGNMNVYSVFTNITAIEHSSQEGWCTCSGPKKLWIFTANRGGFTKMVGVNFCGSEEVDTRQGKYTSAGTLDRAAIVAAWDSGTAIGGYSVSNIRFGEPLVPTPAPTPAPTPSTTPPPPTPAPPPTPVPPTPQPTPQPTPAPTPQPTPAPAPPQCCTGQGGGCAAPCSSGGWCGASESNCLACAGNWGGGSSPTPPAPTPVVNPTPSPPAPTPPAPAQCCTGQGGACNAPCSTAGWCGASESNCLACAGDWCSPASVLVSNSAMKPVGVHNA